jgi:hypothetical protein
MAQSDQTKLEVKAITSVIAEMETLSLESQRRVLWFVADSLGLNDQNPARMQQARQNARTIPLPPGTDPKMVTDALRAAGVPVNQ